MKRKFTRIFACMLMLVFVASVSADARNNDRKKLKAIIEQASLLMPIECGMGIKVVDMAYKKNKIVMTIDLTNFMSNPLEMLNPFAMFRIAKVDSVASNSLDLNVSENINLTPFISDDEGRELVRRARPGLVMRVISPTGTNTVKVSPDKLIESLKEGDNLLEVSL